jgi:type I restriction enzyme, S subunit
MSQTNSTTPVPWPTFPFPDCLDDTGVLKRRKVFARDYNSTGAVPVVDQGQQLIAGWTDDREAAIADALPLIVFGDHTRTFKFVDFPFALGADGTQLLKPQAGFNPRFFYYACLNLFLPNRGYNRHFTLLKEQEIPQPDKPEQERIAALLWKAQRAVEVEEKLIATARELKQSALRQLFTRGLYGERQRETEIGPLPENWDVVRLGDQATVVSKGASPKWQGFQYTTSGVLFVRSQNVGAGRMDWTEKSFLPVAWNEKEKRSVLKSGDVLVNLVGASIGRTAVGRKEIEGANCNQAVSFVRLKPKTLVGEFLVGFLLTPEGQRQIHTTKKDIARANLSLEDVRNLLVPKPDDDEQREIAAIVQTIDRKISVHERKRATLQQLFKTLLHQLMTGQIRVANLDIDVSDVVKDGRVCEP